MAISKVTPPGKSGQHSGCTARTRATSATPGVPEGKPIKIKSMGAGDGFHFTSGRKNQNTGFYIKTDSPNNKAMNLNTFGIIKFDAFDEAIPVDLSVGIKKQATATREEED